jgi:hypothetical protein
VEIICFINPGHAAGSQTEIVDRHGIIAILLPRLRLVFRAGKPCLAAAILHSCPGKRTPFSGRILFSVGNGTYYAHFPNLLLLTVISFFSD